LAGNVSFCWSDGAARRAGASAAQVSASMGDVLLFPAATGALELTAHEPAWCLWIEPNTMRAPEPDSLTYTQPAR
jgi:hypothetical protein